MVIQLKDYVTKCYDNSDGLLIYEQIKNAWPEILRSDSKLVLSFKDFDFITTSFLNASLVKIAEERSISELKTHLSIIDSNKAINDAIRNRLSSNL